LADCEKKYGSGHAAAALARARQYFLDRGYGIPSGGESFDWPPFWKAQDGSAPTPEDEAAAVRRAYEEVAREAASAGQEELVPKRAPAADGDGVDAAADATAVRMTQQNGGRHAQGFGLVVWGCLLILSGILLVAVRPRQRQIPARLPLDSPSGASPVVAQALSKMMTHTGPQQVDDAKPVEPSRPHAPEAKQQTPLVPAATPPPAVRQPHPARTALLVIGIALVGIGLLVALVGVSQHNPHSSSYPSFTGHGFYSSSGGDATAIIVAGVLILITGAGVVLVSQFLRRGAASKR
jgi:uncharacterized membrane protein